MLASVQVVVALAWLALALAIGRRWQLAERTSTALETWVIATASTLALAGLCGVLLGLAGAFSATWISLAGLALAALFWLWKDQTPPPPESPRSQGHGFAVSIAITLSLLGGLALRAPLHSAELAGRDQGTYVLRARHLQRTGSFKLRDDLLATAGNNPSRTSSRDLLRLYPTDGDSWRQGVYEGAYRPGLYLRDRTGGAVVPQFLHMHPVLLALWGVIVGSARMSGILYLYAALSMLAMAAIAGRLWPTRAFAPPLAAALMATLPLAIWVQRTPLTEALTLPLGLAALLAAIVSERRWVAASLLASLAWIRGNAWLAAPLLLAILWLRTAREGWRAPLFYGGLLAASLVLHATSVFPYLYDELHRQLGSIIALRPATLIVLPLAGLALWTLIDGLLATPLRARLDDLRDQLPRLLIIAGAAAIFTFLLGQPSPLARPFSRLDPAVAGLAWPLLGVALLGALRLFRRPQRGFSNTWLLAIASLPVTALALYSQRNLPRAGLFYYGRYLVPELMPLVILLAIHGLIGVLHFAECRATQKTQRRTKKRQILQIALPLSLLAAVAWPLIAWPLIRIPEYEGSERLVQAIASELPSDAVVIAGGEGWHSSHAFNQVGGALLLGHGRQVLPYRSAEVTYATLHALLIDGIDTSERRPPVFLLLGEASHAYTRKRDGLVLAAIDDRLPAPFRTRPVGLYELTTDRLTPAVNTLPHRVTRSALRLGLFEVVVDQALRNRIQSWRFEGGRAQGDGPLTLKHAIWRKGHLCLDRKRKLEIVLPNDSSATSLVLLGESGGLGQAPTWKVQIDRQRLDLKPPPRVRERGTLGPFAIAGDPQPKRLRIRGGDRTSDNSVTCASGQLDELRLLPPSAEPAASTPQIAAHTWSPSRDLGHPPKKAAWVRGRSLSRLRPGIHPKPKLDGLSMVLKPEKALTFPPTEFPPGKGEWIVHLPRIQGQPQSLEIRVDGEPLTTLELPTKRKGSWQSPAIPWSGDGSAISLTLILHGPPQASISVRDLAFFGDRIISTPAE
ncbi:MAG TPA: hypothetical protein ENJ18_19585 [Nannocystis exedens]|nr:hypothetical protein [Nannocystis exedens]